LDPEELDAVRDRLGVMSPTRAVTVGDDADEVVPLFRY